MNLSQDKDLNIETTDVVWKNVSDTHSTNYKITRRNAIAALNSYSKLYDIYTLLSGSLTKLQESADSLRYYFENK